MKVVITTIALLSILSASCCASSYFPEGSLSDRPDINEFIDKWYTRDLGLLEEPSLLELSSNKDIYSYRFLWLRSFEQPLAIRINIDPEGNGTINIKTVDWKEEANSDVPIVKHTKIPLSKENSLELASKIVDSQFWEKPSFDHRRGLDGARWIIEGIMNGKYHVVHRWSPEEGSFRELGLLFIKLSGLEIKEIY